MRRRKAALKVVKQFDAFPKVAEDYQRPTTRGGTLSLLSLSLIAVLVVSEFFYYRSSELHFRYSVDTDLNSQLQFSVDMTIAMPCQYLGADIVDLAGESKSLSGHINMEPSVFQLSDLQQQFFDAKQKILSKFGQSRSLNDLLVIEDIKALESSLEKSAVVESSGKKDSCRIHGNIDVKKVAGNFHITVGKSIQHPQGHAHLNVFVPKELLNFSHRIDHLSFGPRVAGAINPLDSTLKLTEEQHHIYQYYMQVVPTKFRTFEYILETNQYSVTERNRSIDHRKGSHGVAGVFFKYDMSSMMVEIVERRKPFWQFLIRLSGIIGGIFATSGMLHLFIGSIMDGALCVLMRRKSSPTKSAETNVNSSNSVHNNTTSSSIS